MRCRSSSARESRPGRLGQTGNFPRVMIIIAVAADRAKTMVWVIGVRQGITATGLDRLSCRGSTSSKIQDKNNPYVLHRVP